MKAFAVFAVAALGCAARSTSADTDLFAVSLPAAQPRPDFELTTTSGAPFRFKEATAGRLTYLFFGYTSCPDVCPATMANLGAVMNRLTSEERRAIAVVFVTTDPQTDRGPVLAPWLARFDRDAIGLVGSEAAIDSAQRASGVAIAVRQPGSASVVEHAGQVLVYSPDDSTHVAYPFGTRQSELADDLPKLLHRWPGSRR